jgi:hypothetical protein
MYPIKRPRAAAVIAFVALFAVLGGTGYAAAQITSKDIKNGTIRTADLSSSAKRALKGNRGPQGPAGPQGARGIQGPAGPPGSAAAMNLQVVEAVLTVQPGDVDGPQAFCPAGKVVAGTGFASSITHVGFSLVFGGVSAGAGFINDTSIPVETRVQAICAPGSQAAAAARTAALPSRSTLRRQFDRALAELEATR